jgi:hypothetical protein
MIEPTREAFEKRRMALEDAFFLARDQRLMEKMRTELAAMEQRQQLAHVTGIAEDQLLTSLVKAGVRPETLAAIGLIPMVEVAWCDGSVAPEERDAVLNAAVSEGVHPTSAPYELLKHWLDERPDPQIIAAWKEYVKQLSHVMPKEGLAAMKKHVLDRCTRVAAAAGGFLGLSTISKHERAKIDEFAKAWDA